MTSRRYGASPIRPRGSARASWRGAPADRAARPAGGQPVPAPADDRVSGGSGGRPPRADTDAASALLPGRKARVQGKLKSVTVRPVEGVPVLECALIHGDSVVVLRFMGAAVSSASGPE